MPSYRIAFWNVNTGLTSWKDRLETLYYWSRSMVVDLLFLEEVSHTLEDELPEITGMEPLATSVMLDVNGNRSTKDLWVLQKEGNDFQGREARISGMMSRRACVVAKNDDLTVWGLHANSSYKGGLSAVIAVDAAIVNAPGNIVGGDFNLDQSLIPGLKTKHNLQCAYKRPWDWDGNTLQFTQWRKQFGNVMDPKDRWKIHLKKLDTGFLKIIPNVVLDYVVYDSNTFTLDNEENCHDEAQWVSVLKNFDHCPVLFEVRT